MTEGRKTGWASKIKPGVLLSSKSGSVTVDIPRGLLDWREMVRRRIHRYNSFRFENSKHAQGLTHTSFQLSRIKRLSFLAVRLVFGKKRQRWSLFFQLTRCVIKNYVTSNPLLSCSLTFFHGPTEPIKTQTNHCVRFHLHDWQITARAVVPLLCHNGKTYTVWKQKFSWPDAF